MIEAHGLTKSYGDNPAVRGIDFTIRPGEVVGLLGPNGAGKTTIMKILTTFHYPSSGTVEIFGHDVSTEEEKIKEILGYLPENAPHYPEFKVIEYLEFCANARIGKGKTPSGLTSTQAVEKALHACSLGDVRYKLIDELSKGYRQRLGIAQAILHEPQLLILDEPTTGLDPNQILEIRRLIRDLRDNRTIILSTHILQEVEAVCDRVFILHKGTIVAQGSTQEIGDELRGETVFELVLGGSRERILNTIHSLPGAVRVEEDTLLVSALGDVPNTNTLLGLRVKVSRENQGVWKFREECSNACSKAGLSLLHMASRVASLEDLFVRLTTENQASNGVTQ